MAKTYRLQCSNHQGVVTRAFGGRVVSWSPWRTVQPYQTQAEADAEFDRRSRVGLTRWRVMFGSEVVRESK